MIIKFRQYSIQYKKQFYHVLIPHEKVDQFWINLCSPDNITFWDGNRKAFNYIKEACKLLGYEKNMMIYFPIRNSQYKDYWKSDYWYWSTLDNSFDMVLMNDNIHLKLSDWKKIKNTISKIKTIKFNDNHWNEDKTQNYFKYNINHINKKDYPYNKCPFEQQFGQTMFYRLPKHFFQDIYLELTQYLKQNLEKEYMKDCPYSNDEKYANSNEQLVCRLKHNHHEYTFGVELGFHDVQLAKIKKEQLKKRGEKNADTN